MWNSVALDLGPIVQGETDITSHITGDFLDPETGNWYVGGGVSDHSTGEGGKPDAGPFGGTLARSFWPEKYYSVSQ